MTRSETKDRLAKFPKASIPDVERYQVRLEALPQCSPKEFARAQPDWARRTRGSAMVELNEEIGPSQIVGDRLWFGKTFYDGEGLCGVGGLGYCDPQKKRYKKFSPPEIWRWSASALLVEQDVVWIGRYRRPEGEEYSGGFLQYSLVSGEVSEFRVGSVIRLNKRWEGILDIASDGDLYFKGKHR